MASKSSAEIFAEQYRKEVLSEVAEQLWSFADHGGFPYHTYSQAAPSAYSLRTVAQFLTDMANGQADSDQPASAEPAIAETLDPVRPPAEQLGWMTVQQASALRTEIRQLEKDLSYESARRRAVNDVVRTLVGGDNMPTPLAIVRALRPTEGTIDKYRNSGETW